MGTDDAGTTTGLWIGPDDEELLEEFDARFASEPGESRSDAIKRAMRMYLDVDEALDAAPWEYPGERERRSVVRQAIRDHIEDEMTE